MKSFFLLTLLSVMFVSNYATAQICPCDTLELPNGTTGNDIIELICPDGQIRDDAGFTLLEDSIVVFLEQSSYAVVSFSGMCNFFEDSIGNGVENLSPQITQLCRNSLIQRCGLIEDIPTLSEWGLIALAGVMGLIGFMVIRRRKITA